LHDEAVNPVAGKTSRSPLVQREVVAGKLSQMLNFDLWGLFELLSEYQSTLPRILRREVRIELEG